MDSNALFQAVSKNDLVAVREAIAKGADVNARGKYLRTPLHDAASADIAKLLIDKGANVKATSIAGHTPLHYVKSADIGKLLIEKGAEVTAKDSFGSTPLHNAATVDIAKLLIEKGADVTSKDRFGSTPLHSAASVDIAKLLIEKGADVKAKNKEGKTPAETAKTPAIAAFLIEESAKEPKAPPKPDPVPAGPDVTSRKPPTAPAAGESPFLFLVPIAGFVVGLLGIKALEASWLTSLLGGAVIAAGASIVHQGMTRTGFFAPDVAAKPKGEVKEERKAETTVSVSSELSVPDIASAIGKSGKVFQVRAFDECSICDITGPSSSPASQPPVISDRGKTFR